MSVGGRTALVTGGASGIGLAIAYRFARQGASVVLADIDTVALASATRRIKDSGGSADAVACDVRDERQVERAVQHAIDSFGQLDVAVASAGIGYTGTARETDEESWQRVIDVNLKGVFLLAKWAIQAMQGQGGVIITIASQLGLVGGRGEVAYCAAKGGVVNMTRALALDCAPLGIRVNCICPGAVDTPMLSASFNKESNPEHARAEWTELHPLGRLGQPDDIAGAAAFLASDDSSWMTGAILPVDGGFLAQ